MGSRAPFGDPKVARIIVGWDIMPLHGIAIKKQEQTRDFR
jgi:hypothetical protein